MSEHDIAQQYPEPGWVFASPRIDAGVDSCAGDSGAESVEERIERLRSVDADEWARIERLGPSDEELAELRVPPPPEMFKEDWRKQ
jgi:hypothetical protein